MLPHCYFICGRYVCCSVSKVFIRFPELKLYHFCLYSFHSWSAPFLEIHVFYWLWVTCCLLFLMCRTVCWYSMCHLCAMWLVEEAACWSCLSLFPADPREHSLGLWPSALCLWQLHYVAGLQFSKQSLADGHLGRFQSFAITSVAMNNNVHLSFHVFTSIIPLGVDFYERDWWVKK